jgi:hypothetical protein
MSRHMSIVTANLAISLDGFTAGPDQSLEHPFGTGADALTAWMFETDQPGREADKQLLADLHANTGAHIMGRNMFGPGRGAWDPDWTGWWGPEPPYHAPVFVLTHHERPRLPMQGGPEGQPVRRRPVTGSLQMPFLVGTRPSARGRAQRSPARWASKRAIESNVTWQLPQCARSSPAQSAAHPPQVMWNRCRSSATHAG